MQTTVANKTGTITGVSHDVGILYAPGGPIALAVLTRGCRDAPAAEDAISRIARAIYEASGPRLIPLTDDAFLDLGKVAGCLQVAFRYCPTRAAVNRPALKSD